MFSKEIGTNRIKNASAFRRRTVVVRILFLASVFLFFPSIGCSVSKQIRFRSEDFSSLKLLGNAATPTEKEISRRSLLTLRGFDLEKLLKKDPQKALVELQEHADREPAPDVVFAVAEIAFWEAKRRELLQRERALELYFVSTTYAFGYLFDARFQQRRSSYDPHFREACLLYNDSVERILRLLGETRRVDLRADRLYSIPREDGQTINFCCRHLSNRWNAAELEPLQFASDYEIKGLQNEYRQYGLGVPLLARHKPGTRFDTDSKYTTPSLCFPITAILRLLPPGTVSPDGAPLHAAIELYDPLSTSATDIMNHHVPLESDLTTPIAYSIADPRMSHINTLGLVRSDLLLKPVSEVKEKYSFRRKDRDADDPGESEFAQRTIKGLYMMQPFERGKIPVVFVHGLWSSPMAWMEMFNTLRSEPDLRTHYQFYFYFYPTGQPFWISAAQLRDDLADFRRTFDPGGNDPAFDNMILVGHSMGGLISHLQTLDSGREFWKLVSEESPEVVLDGRTEESKSEVLKWFFFQPDPSICRVITIATPHAGSNMSNELTQWFGRKLITLPENLRDTVSWIMEKNKLLNDDSLLKVKTSVDSLSTEQPVFEAMRSRRQYARARYHNIIGDHERSGPISRYRSPSDGVVAVESARLERYESEITVPCEHTTIHSHPKTILEVRRILFEHLHDLHIGRADSSFSSTHQTALSGR